MNDRPDVASGASDSGFLAGVIEGFYGQPWSHAERFELFDWMAGWGLNTYLYAPKDDLKHRAIWRERYSPEEADALGEVIRACQQRSLRFIYALSPGLDIRYSNEADRTCLRARFEQMLALGCQHFALLFDDIPDRMARGGFEALGARSPRPSARWRTPCSAGPGSSSPGARFLFCPTPYCGRMAERNSAATGYLSTIGRELLPEIDVLWTGPEIISREITVAHVRELRKILRRKPLIWDNLHANDYDGRRFYCGPYAGRPPELRERSERLAQQSEQRVPLELRAAPHAGASSCAARGHWDSAQAYLSAMREWLPRFATIGQPVTLEDLILFGDCYYLPHEEGPEAEALFECARELAGQESGRVGQAPPPSGARPPACGSSARA